MLWIGIKLLMPEADDGHAGLGTSTTLSSAIKTIIIVDLVMSIDNVIGLAAVLGGLLEA